MPGSRSPVAYRMGNGNGRQLTGGWCGSGRTGAFFLACLLIAPATRPLPAADLEETRRLFIRGEYDDCSREAAEAIRQGRYGEEWRVLRIASELMRGRYAEASAAAESSLKQYSSSVQLRLLYYRALLHTGQIDRAREQLTEIDDLAARAPWRYTDADDLVALGETALLSGADARVVLEHFFDRARTTSPQQRAPYLAAGRLARTKHDLELAAETFSEAAKLFPDDPDVQFGLAQALADSQPERSQAALEKTLEHNPRHVEALLFGVDRLIDSEEYAEAEQALDRVLNINPRHPRAWAYRAVLAHLQNDPKGETAFRAAALASWPANPEVDHLIGRKLSQKYRFAEGAAHQRQSLAFDPRYLPARIQLSQDLLRLGEEQAGWELAEAAHANDGYDVVTFNLLELRDELARFRTLENEDFIVRMEAHEADVYGPRVLNLLGRAKQTLCEKYGLKLDHKITVEIFPDENDFAVRTFGMPAVSGFLGVCFGKVITANSPVSRGEHPSNWEAVLWHEFCHVVTLELTRNKMPRWLSEGISVYEELQANPTWGQRMNPRYRDMVLAGDLTPVGELSGAFLAPESPLHLQFAYYQSCLVVEFLVERYGLETLKRMLRDLGGGLPINAVLDRHTDGLERLERDFEQFARVKAEQLAPQADWSRPDLLALLNDDGDALAEFLKQQPNNFVALAAHAEALIQEGRWQEAKEPLARLLEIFPEYTGADNAYERLARVHRELKETDAERVMLRRYAARSADALHAFLRLLELETAAGEWDAVRSIGQRILAVNPLLRAPYGGIAQAAEHLGDAPAAIDAYRTSLKLEPDNPAEVHFRLARLLHEQNDAQAKQHVLFALEEAPRFRAAHRLLLEIHQRGDSEQELVRD